MGEPENKDAQAVPHLVHYLCVLGQQFVQVQEGQSHLRHATLWLFTERHNGARHRHEAEGEGVLQMMWVIDLHDFVDIGFDIQSSCAAPKPTCLASAAFATARSVKAS